MNIARPITCLAATLAIAGCGTRGIVVGPPDLDTTSAAAPKCSPISYPSSELLTGNRGSVVIRANVTAAGAIVSPVVETSSSYAALDSAATESIGKWCRFEPAPVPAGATTRVVRITAVFDFVARPGSTDLPVVKVGIQPGLQQ